MKDFEELFSPSIHAGFSNPCVLSGLGTWDPRCIIEDIEIHSQLGLSYKVTHTGCLHKRNLFSHSSWGWEGQDQGIHKFSFFWGLYPRPTGGCLLPVSWNGCPSVVLDRALIPSLYKDASHIGLWHTHVTLFYLHYLFEGPISISLHSEILRTSTYEFWGDTIQPNDTQVKSQLIWSPRHLSLVTQ